MPEPFAVGGLIGQRWQARGGAGGPFGAATGPEEDVPGHRGRRQTFERGEIAWCPDEDMLVSVFRIWNEACFEWSRPRFDHDYFRYDIAFKATGQDAWVPQGQAAAQLRVEGQQLLWMRVQGFGEYAFTIKSCTDPLIGADECGAFTIPVRLRLREHTDSADPGNHPEVGGLIAQRWHELGAWDGPLGLPTTREGFENGIRSQRFEHGSITTAPQFGAGMVVAAYQRHNTVEVVWGGADRAFNAFRVDAYSQGRKVAEQIVGPFPMWDWARPGIGSGGAIFHDIAMAAGEGRYFFFVFPALTNRLVAHPGLFPVGAVATAEAPPPGATPPVSVHFDLVLQDEFGVSDVDIEYPALDGSPAHAFASHTPRMNAIARHHARRRPLGFRIPQPDADNPEMTEGVTLQLIAHLHAVSLDPDFRVRGDPPSRFLIPLRLRERKVGKVGTNDDYDFALKGLMVILYRYRALLGEDDQNFIVGSLVPGDLNGPHSIESEIEAIIPPLDPLLFPEPIIVPETENHLLMIDSSRYLVNQWWFERTGERRYDNNANGLGRWLLKFLSELVRHDFMEFNSRPYQRLALHAILNLREFARDATMKAAAEIVLDYVTMKFAVSSSRGRRLGPYRRQQHRMNYPEGEFNDLTAPRGDAVAGFFLSYTGPADRDRKPLPKYPHGHSDTALIAGLSDYRPPPAAYIVALTTHDPVQHRFHHGSRPLYPPSASPDVPGLERAGPGVEIYYSSPSFLMTAGGMFLNSGYGNDQFDIGVDAYASTARAQATTLVPTRADLAFRDLIRFDPYPDPRSKPDPEDPIRGRAVNMGVYRGFACGADMRVPDLWLRSYEATWDGPWLFLDLNRDRPPFGPLGLYVAAYRTPVAPPSDLDPEPDNLGVLFATEASSMPFATFEQRVRERNAGLPPQFGYGSIHTFVTPDDRTLRFWLQPSLEPYRARVVDMAEPVFDFGELPLVDGPYMSSPGGHDGVIEVRHPGCESAPLVLDYRDPVAPVRRDNAESCPGPLLDRARAVMAYAQHLRDLANTHDSAGRLAEELDALRTAVQVLRGYSPSASLRAEYLLAFGRILRALVRALMKRGPIREAQDTAREGVRVDLAAAAAPGASVLDVADELTRLAGLMSAPEVGLPAESVDAQRAVLEMLRTYTPPAGRREHRREHRRMLVEAKHNLIVRLIADHRPGEAIALAAETIRDYRAYAALPGARVLRTADNLSTLHKQLNPVSATDALNAQQAAVAVLEAFTPPPADRATHRITLADARHTLMARLIDAGRPAEAAALTARTVADYRQYAAAENADVQRVLSELAKLAALLLGAGLSAEAAQAQQAHDDIEAG